MVPPPIVNGVAPKHPARNRNTASIAIESLTAQAAVHRQKQILEALYISDRPYNSEAGASKRGPAI